MCERDKRRGYPEPCLLVVLTIHNHNVIIVLVKMLFHSSIKTRDSRYFVLGDPMVIHFLQQIQGVTQVLALLGHGYHGVVMVGVLFEFGRVHEFPARVGESDLPPPRRGGDQCRHGPSRRERIGVSTLGDPQCFVGMFM